MNSTITKRLIDLAIVVNLVICLIIWVTGGFRLDFYGISIRATHFENPIKFFIFLLLIRIFLSVRPKHLWNRLVSAKNGIFSKENMIRILTHRLGKSISVSCFLVLNLFLFTPYVIYQGNTTEFAVSFGSISGYFLLPSVSAILIIIAIGFVLPEKAYRLFTSVLMALGILVWLQTNLLVWKYGLLDGQGIDWSKGIWRGFVDSFLWVLILSTAGLFYRRIYRIATSASVIMLCAQFIFLGLTSIHNPGLWKNNPLQRMADVMPDKAYDFSQTHNVIHVVLDAFQSDLFQEIIETNPDHYFNRMEGFTFFTDALGSFPTTYMSVPAFLSGRNYSNKIPMPVFLKKTLKGNTIVSAVLKSGYEVDLAVGPNEYCMAPHSNCFKISLLRDIPIQHRIKSSGLFMLDLVLFRCTPHYVKKYVYNNQLWMFQQLFGLPDDNRLFFFEHQAFLRELTKKMTKDRTNPVYKLVHLLSTHPPIVVNEDGEYAGEILPNTRKNMKIQLKVVLDDLLEFFETLKSAGIYDSSLIILHSDHGAGHKAEMNGANPELEEADFGKWELPNLAGSALVLMAIKPPGSKGLLKPSAAQVSLTDIPSTISAIMGLDQEFPAQSVYEIDPNNNRKRKFFYYKWKHENWQSDYFDRLDEFIIKGSVYDKASWSAGGVHFPPAEQ